jgi:hypothetical protein
MNDEDKLFPLPADAALREQARAMARAAWLMGSPLSFRTTPPEIPEIPETPAPPSAIRGDAGHIAEGSCG